MVIFLSMKPEEKMQNHYNPRLEAYAETYKILDWESHNAQFARFRVLTDNVTLGGKSLLDVGCGCGDLFRLLNEQGIDVDYLGVDILPGMIEKAKSIHENADFICGDLFKDSSFCKNVYNVVFTSGIFNLNLGNNRDFFETALFKFTELAADNLVINLLDEKSPDRDERYFYFNPEEAAGLLESHGWRVKIIRGYLNNDFTLIGNKETI